MIADNNPEIPAALAERGLVYSHDAEPGYTRRRSGTGFRYLTAAGGPVSRPGELKRIRSLAIPPAYSDVWICPSPRGHLQATGLDARGRKQYRYHAEWSALAAERKFGTLGEFARALPAMRRRVDACLAGEGVSRDRVLAGIVSLLDRTGYRIGGRRYVVENRSYGLASLLSRHLRQEEGGWVLNFRGKSGQPHRARIDRGRILRLIEDLHELPGQLLFRYEDEGGQLRDAGSAEVNAWLKGAGGGAFSAKQFRTWRANVLCARRLAAAPPGETKRAVKLAETDAVKHTALLLNHTPAVCRKHYLHPAILEAFGTGLLYKVMNRRPPAFPASDPASRLRTDERRVLWLIERHASPGRGSRLS